MVFVFPDIADDSRPDTGYPLLSELQRRAAGRKLVLLVGSLQKRKGVLTLLDTAEKNPKEEWFFVFAGPLARSTYAVGELARIERAANESTNCFFHLDEIPGEPQFNALISACDILYAAYHDFCHSSNMLTKAALFQKPIIVSDGYYMAELVREYGLGRVIRQGDSAQCAGAIRDLLLLPSRPFDTLNGGFARFRDVHSLENLTSSFRELLTAPY